MSSVPWREEQDGLRLAVRVTPRARRNEIAGIAADADGHPTLAVRLAAPPVDGAANSALVKYLAAALDVPRSRVAIRSGETARTKILHISGDGAALAARARALVGT